MPKQRKRGIKGAGSVYQRKSDGRWVGSFIVEETGKRKYIYADNEKDAWAFLQKALQEQKQGTLATGPKQKLGPFLTQWLNEVHCPPLIRLSTHVRYMDVTTKHILPVLGHLELQKITPQKVHAFYTSKRKEGQSTSSIHIMSAVLSLAFDTAVKWRLVSYNPCKGISIPHEAQREAQVLTEEQAKQLLKAAHGGKIEAFIILALSSGLRHGELTALRWGDIDLDQGIVDINSTVSYLRGVKYYERDPKSKSGKRKILIPLAVCTVLRAHKEKQLHIREKAGEKWQDLNLVFCTQYGTFVHSTVQEERFYKLLERNHLPKMHIHDLRHSATSFLVAMGVNLKVIQEMLGHSTLDMTMNVYSHVLPSMQKDAREKMSAFFLDVSEEKRDDEQEGEKNLKE